jgi:probable F420-dependent oxidoreductase
MLLETLLPLGKIDPGTRDAETPLNIHNVADDARLLEDLGYFGLAVEETKDDPFVLLALAARSTSRLMLGTSVAIAFPRAPAITALSAWTIQNLSGGRMLLGLGPQVKGHIERRYGLKWSPPGPWMREYVNAVRAIWNTWQTGVPLDVRGEHYNLNLMVPLVNPGPIEHPEIPIHLAAIGPVMSRVAGEVGDGIRIHPVSTPRYIEEVMFPQIRKGAAKSRRSLEKFDIFMKALFATGADDAELAEQIRDARARIAFYASTPSYAPPFEQIGLGDLAAECQALSRAKRWDELPRLISDDVLEQFCVIAKHDEIAAKLDERFGDLATHVEFSIPVRSPEDAERLRDIAREIQSRDIGRARLRLMGEDEAP